MDIKVDPLENDGTAVVVSYGGRYLFLVAAGASLTAEVPDPVDGLDDFLTTGADSEAHRAARSSSLLLSDVFRVREAGYFAPVEY